MNDRSLIDKINPTSIAFTGTPIHHWLSAWKTAGFRVPPEFGPGGRARCQCDTRNVNHVVNNAWADVCGHLDSGFCSSSPAVQAKNIDDICSIIRRRIHRTVTDPWIAQPQNNWGSYDQDFLNHILEELIEHPDNYFNRLSSFIPATEASVRYSAVLPMGVSAIASSSQPVPCSNSNSNDITNMTSVENTESVDGSTIVEGAM